MTSWDTLGRPRQQILQLFTVVQALRGQQVARLTARSYRLAMYHLERLDRMALVDGVATARGKVWCASPPGLRLLTKLVGRPVTGLTSAKLAAHAAQVSEFLVRALEEQRGHEALSGVGYQIETGLRPGLRCDALVRVGWSQAAHSAAPDGSPLDRLWGPGPAGRPPTERELVLALEVDRGTMPLVRLARKAELYALYYAERWRWQQNYGAFPLPIVVTTGPVRAGAIWLRWRQAFWGAADWAVSCWEWLERGIIYGRWLNADGSVAGLLELPVPVPGTSAPDPAGQ